MEFFFLINQIDLKNKMFKKHKIIKKKLGINENESEASFCKESRIGYKCLASISRGFKGPSVKEILVKCAKT